MRAALLLMCLAPGLALGADWRVAGSTPVDLNAHPQSVCAERGATDDQRCRVDAKLGVIARALGKRLKVRRPKADTDAAWIKQTGLRISSVQSVPKTKGVIRVRFIADVVGARARLAPDAKGRRTVEVAVPRNPHLFEAKARRRFKPKRKVNLARAEWLRLDAIPLPKAPE